MPAIETEEAPACQRMVFPAENSPITKKACRAVIHVCEGGKKEVGKGCALVMGCSEREREKVGWERIKKPGGAEEQKERIRERIR